MKKLFLVLSLALLACLMLVLAVSAKDVYLEEIPEELKVANDTATHFVVFEEEKYYKGSGNTIDNFNTEAMDADLAAAGIDSGKIGKEYLTRFNVPASFNGTLITYVNLNSMKTHKYFRNICGYIQLAGTVSKIHDMNECTSQLRCFDFGENSQIKEIPYCFAPYSKKLMAVKNFPRNLTTVKSEAFNGCYNAFKGELYINAITIEATSFNNSLSFVTGLVFGPDTKNIGNQSLCVRLSEVPTGSKPADNTLSLTYIEFQCDVSQVNFAKQGNNLGAFYFTGTSRSPYSKLQSIILSHPNNAKYVADGSIFNDFTPDGVTVLFNDSNGLDDYVTASHSYVEGDIVYESFMENGCMELICTECGNIKSEPVSAIFDFLGYSVSTFGTVSFSVGYKINFDALNAYEENANVTLSYGILAVAKDKLGDNTPLDENGNATVLSSGAVVVSPTLERIHTYFDGIISGFSTDEQKNAEILLCAYVIVTDAEDNITGISYLADKNEDGSFVGTSYNSLIK